MAQEELRASGAGHGWQGTKHTDALHAAQSLSQEERRRMIRIAAYYKAERRGFAPGRELDDWLAAEKEIEQQLDVPAADLRPAPAPRAEAPVAAAPTAAIKGSAPTAKEKTVKPAHKPAKSASRRTPKDGRR